VLIGVEDAGTGIDPKIADRIFGSLFTTKPHGMGMGLSICQSIIEAHGGHIRASPRVPHGTAFRFTVPTAPGEGATVALKVASEPPVAPKRLDINSLLEERIAFLRTAHPDIVYSVRLAPDDPMAYADEDLIKGVLTNLLENAAYAAKAGGVVLGVTAAASGKVAVEVHDSGPGVNAQARSTLFEPTISFKRGGMGLGLSIARKSALLSGGDIVLVQGELGGAAFRVLLPAA